MCLGCALVQMPSILKVGIEKFKAKKKKSSVLPVAIRESAFTKQNYVIELNELNV